MTKKILHWFSFLWSPCFYAIRTKLQPLKITSYTTGSDFYKITMIYPNISREYHVYLNKRSKWNIIAKFCPHSTVGLDKTITRKCNICDWALRVAVISHSHTHTVGHHTTGHSFQLTAHSRLIGWQLIYNKVHQLSTHHHTNQHILFWFLFLVSYASTQWHMLLF